MALPVLTPEQVDELCMESEGRAFSYQDAPEWFCGIRKCTHMSRDGMGAVGYMQPGAREALAYSMLDHCREYQRLQNGIKYSLETLRSLREEEDAELKRKAPRKRRLSYIHMEQDKLNHDMRHFMKSRFELIGKHFRGFEAKMLITE